jgi:lipopolysaccharide biosynthesis regulator YciM
MDTNELINTIALNFTQEEFKKALNEIEDMLRHEKEAISKIKLQLKDEYVDLRSNDIDELHILKKIIKFYEDNHAYFKSR